MNIVDKILVDPITRGLKFFTKGGVPAYITQVRGRTDGSAAAAGEIGQRLLSQLLRSSGISLTSSTTANVTSVTLTPGNWLVFGSVGFSGNSSDVTNYRAEVSTVSATNNNLPSGYSGGGLDVSATQMTTDPSLMNLGQGDYTGALPLFTQNVASNTTLYLVATCTFTGSTANAYGRLEAIRLP